MSESQGATEMNELEFAKLQFRELSKRISQFEWELESMKRKHKAYGEIIAASKPHTVETSNEGMPPDSTRTLAEALRGPTFFPKLPEDNGFDRLRFNRLARMCVQERMVADKSIDLHDVREFVAKHDPKLGAFPKILERCASFLFNLNRSDEVTVRDDTHRPRRYAATKNFRPVPPDIEPDGNAASGGKCAL